MKWLYFPFKNIDNDPTMPRNLKRYQDKYGANLTVRRLGNLLLDVPDDDMLIIAGHGLPKDSRIGVTVIEDSLFGTLFSKTTQETLTANDLAKLLMRSGLPSGHRYLKTISCGGAGMAVADDTNVRMDSSGGKVMELPLKEVKSVDCFASVLSQAMRELGYYRLLVRGYPGFVNACGLQKLVTMESGSKLGFSYSYWGDGKVPMVEAPTKSLEEEYWFDGWGRLVWP